MTNKTKTLPDMGGRVRNLKKPEYFAVGEQIKRRARINAGIVTYHDLHSDATIAREVSDALGSEITEFHVMKTRQALFGKLDTEKMSFKERYNALSREMSGLRERVKKIEKYLSEPDDRAVSQAHHKTSGRLS